MFYYSYYSYFCSIGVIFNKCFGIQNKSLKIKMFYLTFKAILYMYNHQKNYSIEY